MGRLMSWVRTKAMMAMAATAMARALL